VADRKPAPAERVLQRWRPIAAVLGAVIVVNVLAHALVIRRTGAVSGDREIILGSARERVAAVREEALALERTASKLACARSEVSRVYDEMLSSKAERMTSIQREVRALAKARGLDPDRIDYKATDVKGTGLVRFTITFPLQGEYATLEDFVKAVEESPNFLIVDQISLSEAEGNELVLAVNLATYFQAPDAVALERAFARVGRS
jgi:Tfp pilus assembly protein PilO